MAKGNKEAGKGDGVRPVDRRKWDEGWRLLNRGKRVRVKRGSRG